MIDDDLNTAVGCLKYSTTVEINTDYKTIKVMISSVDD